MSCVGAEHVANAPASRLHSKRATSGAGLENETVASVPLTATPAIDALGAVVSS